MAGDINAVNKQVATLLGGAIASAQAGKHQESQVLRSAVSAMIVPSLNPFFYHARQSPFFAVFGLCQVERQGQTLDNEAAVVLASTRIVVAGRQHLTRQHLPLPRRSPWLTLGTHIIQASSRSLPGRCQISHSTTSWA